jgi:hypothetical protein
MDQSASADGCLLPVAIVGGLNLKRSLKHKYRYEKYDVNRTGLPGQRLLISDKVKAIRCSISSRQAGFKRLW